MPRTKLTKLSSRLCHKHNPPDGNDQQGKIGSHFAGQGSCRQQQKRAGALLRVSLSAAAAEPQPFDPDLVALNDALQTLAAFDPRQSRVVELRFFGGLSEKEVAAVLHLSERTVRREWSVAQAWLYRELRRDVTG